jgi:hypothetical protein
VGLRLVNLLPSSPSDYTKPGQPLQMGLRSDGLVAAPTYGSVILGSLRASLGYTSIQNEGLLPENSAVLPKLEATVGLDTAELIRPLGTEVTRVPFGTGIKLDATGTPTPVGIYSVKVPATKEASLLGYFKFKSKLAWSLATRDWCSLSSMTGMYFGLEHGSHNTICWASLRGGGTGSLVIGGPMQTYNAARPSQQQFNSFNWLAQPNNTVLEMWIVFNQVGYEAPFSPNNTPVVEVWARIAGVGNPVPLTLPPPMGAGALLPTTLLGQFPSDIANFTNYRPGPSDTATLYFGNVGGAGDSLEMLDWALYPDYRVAVREGEAVGNNKLITRSDGPSLYNCKEGRPQDLPIKRWFSMPDAGFLPPSAELFFSPTKVDPTFVVLDKSLPIGSGFQRLEPRLEVSPARPVMDGAVFEAFMSAERIDSPNESIGTGIAIDDGVSLFRLVMLESATRRTIGLSKVGPEGDFVNGYFTPPELDANGDRTDPHLDWRSPKLVKLVVDRVRGRVSMFVDGVRYVDAALAAMPSSVSPVGGRVSFGHLEASAAKSKLNVAFLSYLTQALDPVGPVPPATRLIINKASFATANSRCYYYKNLPTFDERHGIQVDFRAKVTGYTDLQGTAFAKNTWTGSGVQVFLGNKRLHLGFFDCGANGRVIGIIPGSGTVQDITKQTDLGKKFSSPVDWTTSNFFRLSYRPFDRIDVWINNVPSGPFISIPWLNDTDGFDLPQDVTPAAAAFGHFDRDSSSTTSWEFFRFGVGNGFDVSIEPLFPDGLKGYLFGGRTLIQTEFSE